MLTRKSITRLGPTLSFILRRLAGCASEMSIFEITLMREASLSFAIGGGRFPQLAIDPEADPVGVLVGLKCRSDARMLKASSSILCRNLTTGVLDFRDGRLVVSPTPSAATSSNSNSPPMISSIVRWPWRCSHRQV